MPVIVLTTAAGAPGASTTALGLALQWNGPTLLVEADPAGTSVVSGWFRGAIDPTTRNIVNLALSDARDDLTARVLEQATTITTPDNEQHDRLVLIGFAEPSQAPSLHEWWDPIADTFRAMSSAGWTIIIDTGRLTQGSYPMPLLAHADQTLLVCRSSMSSVVRTHPMATQLHTSLERTGQGDSLGLMIIHDANAQQYSPRDIAKNLNINFHLSLPYDSKSAAVFSDGTVQPKNKTLSRILKRQPNMESIDVTHDPQPVVYPSGLIRSYRQAARDLDNHIRRRQARLKLTDDRTTS